VNVSLDQVSVVHGPVRALDTVSLELPLGTQLLLWGSAGGGKTTLLKVIAGLIKPSSGQVRWGGRDVATFERRERQAEQAHLGMIFQSDALFDSRTVLENVTFPLVRRGLAEPEARARAIATLERVGLAHALDKTPETLSGGMRKRVGVARAIVVGPDVLLADDPFAGLDPNTERSVGQLLLEVSAGRTLVIAVPEPPRTITLPTLLELRAGKVVRA
jgi:phospholipid/cholesterol/gamma-HCH transport system ATP-binding protein